MLNRAYPNWANKLLCSIVRVFSRTVNLAVLDVDNISVAQSRPEKPSTSSYLASN